MADRRQPMTPAEYAAARWEFCWTFAPQLHQTSGFRSPRINASAGSTPESKHLIAMADDFDLEPDATATPADLGRRAAELGLWWKLYSWGIHIQGVPPGPVALWWRLKYLPADEGRD